MTLSIAPQVQIASQLRQSPTVVLLSLTTVYLLLGSVYALTSPPFEKTDEEGHYAYVAHLVRFGQLPPLTLDPASNPAGLIAGHPPLFYGLSAALVILARLDVTQPLPPINPFWAYPAPGTSPDNKNRFVHLAEGDYTADYALRLFSLALGAATVPCAYGLAFHITRRRAAATLTAAFIAVHPQYLFIASSVSNDGLVTSLATAALWALLQVQERPTVGRRWVLFGALAGLATLAKTSAILLPMLGASVGVWAGWQQRSWRLTFLGVFASLGGWLLLSGGWYTRNALFFGDPLGVALHAAPFPEGAGLTLADLPQQLVITSISFWAAFGWTNILLPEWAYWGLRAVEVCASVGLFVVAPRLWREGSARGRYSVLLIYVLLMTAAYVWWATRLQGTLGRLLFPALAPLLLLLVLGLRRLWRSLPYISLAFLSLLALLGPLATIRAYQPPALLIGLPATVQPTQLFVGDFAELVGYQLPSRALPPSEATPLTLCWQPRAQTAEPLTVFVQLVGEGNYVAGARNTYPGLGRYATTIWQPGALFCDEVNVPVNAEARAPALYVVHAGMFDLRTGQRASATAADETLLPVIELGTVKVAGSGPAIPPNAQSVEAEFVEPMRLQAYELEPLRAGQSSALTLYWQATGAPSADFTVFVHLLDSDSKLVAQSDAPPGSVAHAGRYPTSWWAAGETIQDTHTLSLPADLSPGDYKLRVGLYQPETGQRVALISGADSVELGALNVAP